MRPGPTTSGTMLARLSLPRLPLVLLCALAAGACDRGGNGETHVVVIDDPAFEGAFLDEVVAGATAEGLVRFDARGEIEPALAERWAVSDDGLSYIFRLAKADWPDGTPVDAKSVVAALKKTLATEPLGDALGAIDEVVAMTDRVIEIRLVAPRPHLLALLAQPALGVRHGDSGAGPFALVDDDAQDGADDGATLHLAREVGGGFDADEVETERVHLDVMDAQDAIAAFVAGKAELVLGGTYASLPLVREAAIGRGALRYDPVAGLFGLLPTGRRAPFDDAEARAALSRAIDRAAIIEDLGVPSLLPRATLFQDGLELNAPPTQPEWLRSGGTSQETPARFAAPGEDAPTVRVALGEGPGARILFDHLARDWGPLGLAVEAAAPDEADFVLVDRVAPSESAAWFVRQFSCARVPVCDEDIDLLVEAARLAPFVDQRRTILADAGSRMDQAVLFVPIAAPIRWSLVAPAVSGFAENRFARHPLAGLKRPVAPATAR